ncbi:MAG: hypothetical protein QM817_34440 [Archangium sp.]
MKLSLRVDGARLISTWTNDGTAPVALAFWWNRRMRVVDASGAEMKPGGGPVLPCGVPEDWTELEPGASFERDEPLACTQPAGGPPNVGWSYDHLAAGTYRVTLLFQAPPAHGFSQSPANPRAFSGALESNTVEFAFAPPEKPRGLLSRLFGG